MICIILALIVQINESTRNGMAFAQFSGRSRDRARPAGSYNAEPWI